MRSLGFSYPEEGVGTANNIKVLANRLILLLTTQTPDKEVLNAVCPSPLGLSLGPYEILGPLGAAASKAQAIEALALTFERGDIRVLNDPVLVSELEAYQAERLPSGLCAMERRGPT